MRAQKINGLLFLVGLMSAWELAARADLLNPLIVPPLSRILGVFWNMLWSGQTPMQILLSMKGAAMGYLLAAAIFIPLGILMGLSERIYRTLEVIVEVLRPVPPPVVMPASRVAARLAAPAVSQAERMTTSALSFRS